MNEDFSHFRDPRDQCELRHEGDRLVALDGTVYPIVQSIPRFVNSENYAADFGDQWQRFPESQLDSNTGKPITRARLERCFRGKLKDVKGRRLLEAGSGAGRFTEIFLDEGADLDSFDYSHAVEANAENHRDRRFFLAQADIRAMPFARETYDYVACLGVLQHTPDTEESISKLWEMVRPGGILVIDHYRRNFWLRMPPPIGDAEKIYRQLILRLPQRSRFAAVKKIVDFWFPIYWKTRHSKLIRRILARVGGIHFYYDQIDLGTRERHYEWALLDTNDGMTDAFKRYRTNRSIETTLEKLGAADIHVWTGGNGVEAWCRKPTSQEAL